MKKEKRIGKWFLGISIGLLAISLFSGCQRQIPVVTEDDVESPSSTMQPVKQSIFCPLDGQELIEEPLRPILITIDNYAAARPQCGISVADIMYEIPAEGGISRYLGLFYHGTSEKIGPVRSARPYLVDIAREWQAIYIHAGGSNDALAYLAKKPVLSINEINNSQEFWRDKNRKAPHNLYTSTEKLLAGFERRGWTSSVKPIALNISPVVGRGEPCNEIIAKYPYANTSYTYRPETGKYLRFVNGEPCVDGNNNEQVCVSNILVQKVSSKVLDKEGRLEISMVGSGSAWLFTRGNVWEGTWQRTELDGKTRFCTTEGIEFLLSPGQTWVQVIDQNVKFSYQYIENNIENSENNEK